MPELAALEKVTAGYGEAKVLVRSLDSRLEVGRRVRNTNRRAKFRRSCFGQAPLLSRCAVSVHATNSGSASGDEYN